MGRNRPAIIVPWDTLEDSEFEEGDIVEIEVDETPLSAYITWSFDRELRSGECRVTRPLGRRIPEDVETLVVKPGELPLAKTITLGTLITGGITMGFPTWDPEMREELDQRIPEEILEPDTIVYVGQSVEVREPVSDGVLTASRSIRELKPGLVARVGPETEVVRH